MSMDIVIGIDPAMNESVTVYTIWITPSPGAAPVYGGSYDTLEDAAAAYDGFRDPADCRPGWIAEVTTRLVAKIEGGTPL